MDFWNSYLEWIRKNPGIATDIENSVKYFAYFVVGFFSNDNVSGFNWTELFYSAGNIYTFVNDRIFELATSKSSDRFTTEDKIKYILGMVEAAELFFEITGYLSGADFGRWAAIIFVQIVKATCRFALIYKQRRMISTPIMPTLDRNNMKYNRDEESRITLKRSGRVVPSLFHNERHSVFEKGSLATPNSNNVRFESILKGLTLSGEIIYIVQPLIHLLIDRCTAKNSWKPWIISATTDVISQCCYINVPLNSPEKRELKSRRIRLLIYLLRSPFYNNFTKNILYAILYFAQYNVPFAGTLSEILINYLPHYQKTYTYIWAK